MSTMFKYIAAATLLATAAVADERMIYSAYSVPPSFSVDAFTGARVPDAATKREALLAAFAINGNSMSGYGNMVDMTGPVPVIMTIVPRPVPTMIMKPPTLANPPAAKVAQKSADICARHGLRKVYRGRSWRCRA